MTNKLAYTFIFLPLVASALVAQPKLSIVDTLNFGTVVPEQTLNEQASVHGKVVVKNVGDSVLIVSDVHPSCGCTMPDLVKDTLNPGEETDLEVHLELHQVAERVGDDVLVVLVMVTLLGNFSERLGEIGRDGRLLRDDE